MTNREFITRTIVSLSAWGNAYWLKPFVKGRAWKYTAVLDPSKVVLNIDGSWTISIPRRPGEAETTQTRTVSANDLTHIPFLALPGIVLGLSPLGALSQTLGFSKDLHEYAGNIYTDGAYPSGYLSTDQILPDTIADKMKQRWVAKFGKAAREPAVLSGGLKYNPLVINPVDAEFVEAFNLSVQDIARGFGVPSSFMGVSSGDSLTYTTDESEIKRFKTTTLTAYTGPIEDALTNDRGPTGEKYRFNYATLERADTSSRFAAYAVAQMKSDGSGWLTVEEIRAMEGLPAQMRGGQRVPGN
jgi:HK97 family phage portal protein